ncbi:MAG: bifunctional phosphoribosyl-AMP cyclohydrolase/phosphoribosyl-ATP diphosphatase HisIE [Paenibacillaceae bacterium]|jgi:phosphoribosyl-ATP pyrophosphohydrolase/phosphoribosyl-AMP cyclohydrolase|nr:bifunctional phosphoribosyl-AMP cyclohydrolase/phosphoribosyl-ATP diphosphatase HisIE [Paenibacillaceae bacterium]
MNLQCDTLLQRIRWDEAGLVPVVVQHAHSGIVLTVAYANEEAVLRTCALEQSVFWSRSRRSLWHKGETSGHVQRVVALSIDCDGDALIYHVVPQGPACHTGNTTCFYRSASFPTLHALAQTIEDRDVRRPEGSYTTYLFNKGTDKICKKIGEESAEVIVAAKNTNKHELMSEASDLLFHLLVLLRDQRVALDDVLAELARRQQQ